MKERWRCGGRADCAHDVAKRSFFVPIALLPQRIRVHNYFNIVFRAPCRAVSQFLRAPLSIGLVMLAWSLTAVGVIGAQEPMSSNSQITIRSRPTADLNAAPPRSVRPSPKLVAQAPATDGLDPPLENPPLPGRAPRQLPTQEVPPRDPTIPGPDIRPLLDPVETQAGTAKAAMPSISLRGRIVSASGKATGVLEVGGKFFLIDSNSQVDTSENGNPLTIRVKSLTANNAVVEIEQLGRAMQLR